MHGKIVLTPTYVYNVNGSVVGFYLYYDASIEYFGNKHLPYAILAVFVVLIFIFLPMLLLYLIVVFLCWICSRREIGQKLGLKIK